MRRRFLAGLLLVSMTAAMFSNINCMPVYATNLEEENAVITEGGKDISLSEGVIYIKTENGRDIFEITSGKYSFTVENR